MMSSGRQIKILPCVEEKQASFFAGCRWLVLAHAALICDSPRALSAQKRNSKERRKQLPISKNFRQRSRMSWKFIQSDKGNTQRALGALPGTLDVGYYTCMFEGQVQPRKLPDERARG